MQYDKRHGSPYDRGAADAYYRRPFNPHYFIGASCNSNEIAIEPGTEAYKAYTQGYQDQEAAGETKKW